MYLWTLKVTGQVVPILKVKINRNKKLNRGIILMLKGYK
jgi:hypothetical protein